MEEVRRNKGGQGGSMKRGEVGEVIKNKKKGSSVSEGEWGEGKYGK